MTAKEYVVCALVGIAITFAVWMASARSATFLVKDDHGGYIIDYVMLVERARVSGAKVRFMGECASACTLLLSLPNNRLCLGPKAKFVFHAAWGASPEANKIATKYMMSRYPMWVKNWLDPLTDVLQIMPHSYAAQYIRACK